MKKILLAGVLLGIGCGSLPPIHTAPISIEACKAPFLTGEWRLVHSIMATMPTGDMSSVIGITVADPAKQILQSAIMTLEGLVVFDATYTTQAAHPLSIKRSIKPFDSVHFAHGLMEDIRLMFFQPDNTPIATGTLSGSAAYPMCRYRTSAEKYIDVIQKSPLEYTINRYTKGYSLERTLSVTLKPEGGHTVPLRVELVATGVFGYKLVMNLVSAEAVK